MFLLGKKKGLLSLDGETNGHSSTDVWELEQCKSNNTKLKRMMSCEDHRAWCLDKNLRQNYMKDYLIHGPNKARDKVEIKEPVAMLPTTLIDALMAGKEEMIHNLEAKISTIQDEFEKTKINNSAKLKRLWSLGNNSLERKHQNKWAKNQLHRPSSSPNILWGKRKQLVSLLTTEVNLAKSANNSQENIFLRWNPKKSFYRDPTKLPILKNDLEVQLWLWMERVDEVEKEMFSIRTERDELEKELKQSYEESQNMADQLTSLQINHAKEKVKTLKLMDELERKSKLLEECKEKFDASIKSKDDEMESLKLSFATQKEVLEKLQQVCGGFKERNKILEEDKTGKDQLLWKLEVLDDELNQRHERLEAMKREASLQAEKLALSKENFDKEVKIWKAEATEVREDLLKVEQARDQSLAEIERLQLEVKKLRSKCSALEEEKMIVSKNSSDDQLNVAKDKKNLELKISNLVEKLKWAEMRASEETNSRIDLERKLEDVNAKTIALEKNLNKETEGCLCLQRELELIRKTLEDERIHFRNMFAHMEKRSNEERETEKLKIQKLLEDLELERKRHNECKSMLKDECEKQKFVRENEYNYNQLLKDKQRLSEIAEEKKNVIQDLETNITALSQELSTEKLKLQTTTEALNEEIVKGEKIHHILRDSLAETLKKERLIKTMKDELKTKSDIEFQLRCANEKLVAKHINTETFQKDLAEERAKCKDLTQRCKELLEELSKEKNHSTSLSEKLDSIEVSLEAKIHHLEEQLSFKNLKTEEEVTSHKNLERKMENLLGELTDERVRHAAKLDSIAAENTKLKADLENVITEEKEREKKLEEMIQGHKDEIAELTSSIAEEHCKRLNAEEEVEKLQEKIEGILKVHMDEKNRMQVELKEIMGEKESKEELEALNQNHKKEVEDLNANVEDERSKRLKADEEAKNLLKKNEELCNTHMKEKILMQEEFQRKIVECEQRHADEQKKFKETEMRLQKEKEEMAEDLRFVVSQEMDAGPCGDGGTNQRNFIPDSRGDELKAEEKLRGMRDYHQRLLNEVCSRNLSREAAIRRAAEIEILKAREETMSLRRHLEAQRAANEVITMKLKKDLIEARLMNAAVKKAETKVNENFSNVVSTEPKKNLIEEIHLKRETLNLKSSDKLEKKDKCETNKKICSLPVKDVKSEPCQVVDDKTKLKISSPRHRSDTAIKCTYKSSFFKKQAQEKMKSFSSKNGSVTSLRTVKNNRLKPTSRK